MPAGSLAASWGLTASTSSASPTTTKHSPPSNRGAITSFRSTGRPTPASYSGPFPRHDPRSRTILEASRQRFPAVEPDAEEPEESLDLDDLMVAFETSLSSPPPPFRKRSGPLSTEEQRQDRIKQELTDPFPRLLRVFLPPRDAPSNRNAHQQQESWPHKQIRSPKASRLARQERVGVLCRLWAGFWMQSQ
jgi:hypothetical protein